MLGIKYVNDFTFADFVIIYYNLFGFKNVPKKNFNLLGLTYEKRVYEFLEEFKF